MACTSSEICSLSSSPQYVEVSLCQTLVIFELMPKPNTAQYLRLKFRSKIENFGVSKLFNIFLLNSNFFFYFIFIRFVFVLSKKAQGQLSWSSVEYNSVVCHLHLLSNVLGVIVQYFIKTKNGSNELHSNSTAMLTCITSLYGRPLLSVKVCHVRRLV